MRDRKFKAWDRVKKEWVTSFSISSWGEVIGIPNAKDCVLVEWTGLHDKHGNEIWEGDILRGREPETEITTGELRMIVGDAFVDYAAIRDAIIDNKCIEIIGNIYENPDLLATLTKKP